MRPITANDLMNPSVLLVRDQMTLAELAAFLVDHEITGAPVKNRFDKLVGVVSLVDVVRAGAELSGDTAGAPKTLHVADVMTPVVYTVSEDATVSEIASTMLDNHLQRVLVTRDGQPLGIISTSDLLGLLIDEDDG